MNSEWARFCRMVPALLSREGEALDALPGARRKDLNRYMVRSDDVAGQLLADEREVERLPFLETVHVTLFL